MNQSHAGATAPDPGNIEQIIQANALAIGRMAAGHGLTAKEVDPMRQSSPPRPKPCGTASSSAWPRVLAERRDETIEEFSENELKTT